MPVPDENAVAGTGIRPASHPAVVFALPYGTDLLQQADCPSAMCLDPEQDESLRSNPVPPPSNQSSVFAIVGGSRRGLGLCCQHRAKLAETIRRTRFIIRRFSERSSRAAPIRKRDGLLMRESIYLRDHHRL